MTKNTKTLIKVPVARVFADLLYCYGDVLGIRWHSILQTLVAVNEDLVDDMSLKEIANIKDGDYLILETNPRESGISYNLGLSPTTTHLIPKATLEEHGWKDIPKSVLEKIGE